MIATIFITSGFSKFRKMDEHIRIVMEYQILPRKWTVPLATIEVYMEIIFGFLLMIGLLQNIVLCFLISLLTIYNLAISINLIRGRSMISCGCGGIINNHKLTWFLVHRNLVFILVIVWLIFTDQPFGRVDSLFMGYSFQEVFPSYIYFELFLLWSIILFFAVIKQLYILRSQIISLIK